MADDDRQLGAVTIDNEVLRSIAAIAAKKVAGVNRISTSLVDGLAHWVRGGKDAGVKVVVGEGEVGFELKIVVDYGVNIPEVTFRVQKAIREEVERMSGLKVVKVDVVVHGVNTDGRLPASGDGTPAGGTA